MPRKRVTASDEAERHARLPELRAVWEAFARRKGVDPAIVEDFVSWASVTYLAGSGRAWGHWLWVDFVREMTATREGDPYFEEKLAFFQTRSLDAQLIPVATVTPSDDDRLEDFLRHLPDERSRLVFRLYALGFTQPEIGEMITQTKRIRVNRSVRRVEVPITGSRVCQILTSGIARIRRALRLPDEAASVRQSPGVTPEQIAKIPVYREPFEMEERTCLCGCGKRWKQRKGASTVYWSKQHEPGFYDNPEKDVQERKEANRDRFNARVKELVAAGTPPTQIFFIAMKERLRTSWGKAPTKGTINTLCSKYRKELGLPSLRNRARKGTAVEPVSQAPAAPVEVSPPSKRRKRTMENFTLPEIESNVPVPASRFVLKTSPFRDLALRMKEGDSVVLDKGPAKSLFSAIRSAGHKAVTRAVEGEKYRVWKMEPLPPKAEAPAEA